MYARFSPFLCPLLCAALTLYSEAAPAVPTQYESYVSGSLESAPFTTFGGDWHAQTFFVSESHNVNGIQLKLYRQNLVPGGALIASIRSTETKTFPWGDLEVPFGVDLASGSIANTSITTSLSGAWYEINLNDTVQLTIGKEYAVVVRSSGDAIKWKAAQTYLDGNPAAGFLGTEWSQTDPAWDFLFQVWGDPENTAALATATGTGVVDIMPGSGQLAASTMEALAASDLPQQAQDTLPQSGDFTHGFFAFEITGVTPGGTETVTLILPENAGVGSEYWKYHNGSWVEIPLGSDDGDNVITITLVDGGLGDGDGVADGTIRDPGGPALVVFADGFESP